MKNILDLLKNNWWKAFLVIWFIYLVVMLSDQYQTINSFEVVMGGIAILVIGFYFGKGEREYRWSKKFNKNMDIRNRNKLLKLTPEEKAGFLKRTREMEQNQKEHPELMLWYLYQTGQVKDLTKEDIRKINIAVRENNKNRPYNQMWEIKE